MFGISWLPKIYFVQKKKSWRIQQARNKASLSLAPLHCVDILTQLFGLVSEGYTHCMSQSFHTGLNFHHEVSIKRGQWNGRADKQDASGAGHKSNNLFPHPSQLVIPKILGSVPLPTGNYPWFSHSSRGVFLPTLHSVCYCTFTGVISLASAWLSWKFHQWHLFCSLFYSQDQACCLPVRCSVNQYWMNEWTNEWGVNKQTVTLCSTHTGPHLLIPGPNVLSPSTSHFKYCLLFVCRNWGFPWTNHYDPPSHLFTWVLCR